MCYGESYHTKCKEKVSLLKPHTNFEKFKNMTIDEMADFFVSISVCPTCPVRKECKENRPEDDTRGCRDLWKQWLSAEMKI